MTPPWRADGCDLEPKACGGEPLSRRLTPARWRGSTPGCSGGPSVTRSRARRFSPLPRDPSMSCSSRRSDTRVPWPPADGQQRPMMHFDFQVGDLDSAVAEAVALGASVAAYQPQDNVRVLL